MTASMAVAAVVSTLAAAAILAGAGLIMTAAATAYVRWLSRRLCPDREDST
jgi:hypothetical protein